MQDHSTTSYIPHACLQCGKEFFDYKSKNRLYCSRACFEKSENKREVRACSICGKSFEVPPCRQDDAQFCSRECSAASKRKWHEFICKQCNNTFSVPTWRVKDNPTWCSNRCRIDWNKAQGKSPRIRICPQCGKEFMEKSTDKRHYCSRKCHSNAEKECRIIVQCEICGRLKEIVPAKLKRFRVCSAECRWIYTTLNMPRVSSIELLMAKAFDQVHLMPEVQYVIGPFVADFAFPEHMLVVECDGDYWHNLPDVQKKDRIKNYYYWKNGWQVLRFWEHEINQSPANCVALVQEKLQSLTS